MKYIQILIDFLSNSEIGQFFYFGIFVGLILLLLKGTIIKWVRKMLKLPSKDKTLLFLEGKYKGNFKSLGREITKEDFLKVYNSHKPNWYVKLIHKFHFTKPSGGKLTYGRMLAFFMLSILIVGWLLTAFEAPRLYIAIATYTYMGLLPLVVISTFIANFLNNGRLKKIMRELGITLIEYRWLSNKYLI